MADVEITIRLRRKTCDHRRDASSGEVRVNDIADEVAARAHNCRFGECHAVRNPSTLCRVPRAYQHRHLNFIPFDDPPKHDLRRRADQCPNSEVRTTLRRPRMRTSESKGH